MKIQTHLRQTARQVGATPHQPHSSQNAKTPPRFLPGLALVLLGSLTLLPGRSQADNTLRLNIARTNSIVVLTWTNAGATLESSLVLTGGWSGVTGAVSPRVISPTNLASFFRLRTTNTVAGFAFRYVAPTFTTSIGDPFGCGCTSPENPNSLAAGGGAQDNGMRSVLLHSGELTQDSVDLEIPGLGFDWRLERSYRSGMSYDGPVGQGWDFNYNRRLYVETAGNVLCINGLGRADRYLLNTNSTYNSPAGFYTQLARNLDGTFVERDRHGTKYSYSATNSLGIARLISISDRNNNQMTFQYNAEGQLATAVDTLNHLITYGYDSNGRLIAVTDHAGRTSSFAYDSVGNLISATSPAVTGTPNGNDFPFGKKTFYGYSSFNHNLISITAPNEAAVGGPARLLAQYDTNPLSTNAGRLVSLRLGGTNATGIAAGGTISYTYARFGVVSSNDYATPVFQNTVTNRNGNVAQYRFNQLGNIVSSIQFTRGLRPGDPAGYTNTFAFNRDGEMIARTNAELDSVLYTFDSGNPDRLQQGNQLQIRWLPGPRGGDQTQIVVSKSYETNFNFVATATDGRGNPKSFKYDSRGNLTNITDRIASVKEDFNYNANGQVTEHFLPNNGNGRQHDVRTYYSSGPQKGYLQQSIVDSGGFNLTNTYEYNAVGDVTRMIDPSGYDTLYDVNQRRQIVRISSAAVRTSKFPVRYQRSIFYSDNDDVFRTDIQNIDDGGNIVASLPNFTTTNAFDILGSVVSTVQQVTANHFITTKYSYDRNANRMLFSSGVATSGLQTNNVASYLFDERDLVFQEIRAPGDPGHSTKQFTYDKDANLVLTLDGLEDTPHATVQSWTGYNRIKTSTDAMGNVTTFYYDDNNNVVSNRLDGELVDLPGSAGNVRLAATSFTFDLMDRLMIKDAAWFDPQTQAPIGTGHAITQTFYSDNSQVVAVIDPNNNTNHNSYDTANRLSVRTDAKGDSVTYIYDARGNVTVTKKLDISDLGGPNQSFTTTDSYDELNRLVAASDNQTNLVQFAYNSLNQRTLVTAPRGEKTRYEYDVLGRLLATRVDMNANGLFTDAVDIVTLKIWDDNSRLTGQTDDNNNTTTYAYDALDRQTGITYADGTTNNYTYNVHSDRVTSRDANGSAVTSIYNLLGSPMTNLIARAAGVLGTTNEICRYDGRSLLVSAANNDSTVTFAYDSLGRVTTETQQLVGSPVRTITAAFDAVGNQTNLVYPGALTIARTYDALNLLATVKQGTNTLASHSHVGGRLERRKYNNGTQALYTYDGLGGIPNGTNDFGVGQLAHIQSTNFTTGGLIDDLNFSYDRDRNKARTDNLLLAQTRTYAYDADDQLVTSVVSPGGPTNIYNLDNVGNRTSVVSNGVTGTYTMSNILPQPGDFQMNQYTLTPGLVTNSYDLNGNLINATGRGQLAYNYKNQIVRHISPSGQTNTYIYDFGGRLLQKVVGTNAANLVRIYYSDSIEIENQNSADTTQATFVWGDAIDDLLTMTRSNVVYYFFGDDLHNVRKATDASGIVREQTEYADFGSPTFFNGAGASISNSAIGNPHLYSGRRFNLETGLYYYRARFMQPADGRFITRDRIGIWGDCAALGNGYTYAANNPLSRIDPQGTDAKVNTWWPCNCRFSCNTCCDHHWYGTICYPCNCSIKCDHYWIVFSQSSFDNCMKGKQTVITTIVKCATCPWNSNWGSCCATAIGVAVGQAWNCFKGALSLPCQ